MCFLCMEIMKGMITYRELTRAIPEMGFDSKHLDIIQDLIEIDPGTSFNNEEEYQAYKGAMNTIQEERNKLKSDEPPKVPEKFPEDLKALDFGSMPPLTEIDFKGLPDFGEFDPSHFNYIDFED